LCLVTTNIPSNEINSIRKAAEKIDNLSLDGKIRWIRNNCPYAYKHGYKEISHDNIKIVSEHKIK